MSRKQTRSSGSGDGRPALSFELDESAPQTSRRQYEGPFQDAVYSPLPLFESEKLIGESEVLYRLFDLIGAASRSDQNVLIQGETGTGKNLVARTIHSQSDRSENWLIVVNCALIGAEELEPILLGPTALSSEGVFEAAVGGTIVFDHVDELGPNAQAHLNHLLETHTFENAPESRSAAFDLRLLFLATRPLPDEEFKRDLYYRLNQFPIRVPPLRARPGDIIPLARHFLQPKSERARSSAEKFFSRGTKTALQEHEWPGNVRELQNAVRRAAAVSERPTISEEDLPPSIRESEPSPSQETPSRENPFQKESSRESTSEAHAQKETSPSQPGENSGDESSPFFVETNGGIPEIEEIKREAVKRAYDLCDGDIDRAAVELGIARSTMYRLLKRYDLK